MITDRSADVPEWVSGLPWWVNNSEVKWLSTRPWMAGFIEPTDRSLRPAEERFARSQRQLRSIMGGSGSSGSAELIEDRGYETTAFRFGPSSGDVGVTRSVKVDSPDANTIEGLAVPFGERSHIVAVARQNVYAFEQFDEESFAYLPTSCGLREAHDYELPEVGRVTSLRKTAQGLLIEARLDERNRLTWLRRWMGGRYCSLSITFGSAPIGDKWTVWNGHPLRTVRGGRLVDVAVVPDPAYASARVTRVFRKDHQ